MPVTLQSSKIATSTDNALVTAPYLMDFVSAMKEPKD